MKILKKIPKLFLISVSTFVAGVIVILPIIASAGPSAIPPDGIVDAQFDTVTSGRFIDEDNSFFYLDPSTSSYVNNIQLSGRVTDYPSGSYYIDPASDSYLNNVYGGGNYFFRYYDRTDPAYYLDPSDTNYSLLVAGKVGIGNTAPATKLHVTGPLVGNRGQLTIEAPTGGSSQITFYDGSTYDGYIYYDKPNSEFEIGNYNNGSYGDLLLNSGGGNVGIGTASPVTDLTVTGTTGLRVTTGEHPNVFGDMYNVMAGAPDGGFNINSQTGGSWADIRFRTNGVERMILESAGRLGIGTSAPEFLLHVADRIKLDGVNAGMWIESGTDDWFFGRTGSNLRFYNAGDKVTIQPTGDIDSVGKIESSDGTYSAALWPDGGVQADANMTLSGYLYNNVGNPAFNPNNDVMIGDNLNVTGYIYDGNSSYLTVQDNLDVNGTLIANYIDSTASTSYGIYAAGNTMGGRFADRDNTSNWAYVGNYPYGIRANGDSYGVYGQGLTAGGYFDDTNSTAFAYAGYGSYGLYGAGNTYGVYGSGTTNGGYFIDSNSGGYYARVGYGTYGIYSNGYLYGSTGASSDRRLKKDVKPLNSSLGKIMQLEPVEFEYKAPDSIPGKQLGFIAQDAENIVPELVMQPDFSNCSLTPEEIENSEEPLVNECPGAYYGFKYGQMTPLLTEAVQELKGEKDDEVAELKAEIAELRAVICELKPEADVCNL